MAASLWRMVLGIQLALAILVALTARALVPALDLWVTCAIAIGAFVAIQYLLGTLVITTSSLLAAQARSHSSLLAATCAALSEPYYFALAEFSMTRAPHSLPAGQPQGEPARAPLLLVHGLACNSGIWRWLIPRLRAAGFDPIHAVNLEPVTADIDSLVRQFERELLAFHRANGNLPVTLLAHSMGGLICRAALHHLDPGILRRLVTIATPNHGAALARLVNRVPIAQMRPDAPWLAALNASQQFRLPVPVTSIFSLDDNFVMPGESCRLVHAKAVVLHGLGHFGLLVSRRAAQSVLRALRETP